MTPTSADTIRAAYGVDIPVTLPGGHIIICRRPDLDLAIFQNVLTLPLLKTMFAEIGGVVGAATGEAAENGALQQSVEDFLTKGAKGTAETVDIWVCLAAKAPRIVRDAAEAGPDALWLEDLPLAARLAIFSATFTLGEAARLAAARSFRPEPDRADPRSDGTPVPGAPLVDVADQ